MVTLFALIVVCLLGFPAPHFVPAPRFVPEPCFTAASEKTPAELLEIDRKFWQANRYRLCPGSCGMMCASHGGGWVLEQGEADPADPSQKPAEPTLVEPTETRPEPAIGGCPGSCSRGSCGPRFRSLFRRR